MDEHPTEDITRRIMDDIKLFGVSPINRFIDMSMVDRMRIDLNQRFADINDRSAGKTIQYFAPSLPSTAINIAGIFASENLILNPVITSFLNKYWGGERYDIGGIWASPVTRNTRWQDWRRRIPHFGPYNVAPVSTVLTLMIPVGDGQNPIDLPEMLLCSNNLGHPDLDQDISGVVGAADNKLIWSPAVLPGSGLLLDPRCICRRAHQCGESNDGPHSYVVGVDYASVSTPFRIFPALTMKEYSDLSQQVQRFVRRPNPLYS